MENAPLKINPNDAITDPINKLTLEFLMNRSKYKKYVEKVDPHKHRENEKHLQKIWKYKNRILNITSDLVDNPELMITLDVGDCFHGYMRTVIRYFEMKDMEKHDPDVLFDDLYNDDDQDIYKTSPTHCDNIDTIRQQQIAYNILPRYLDTTYNDESTNIIENLRDKENESLKLVDPGQYAGRFAENPHRGSNENEVNEEPFKEHIANKITPTMKSFWSGIQRTPTTNTGSVFGGNTVKKTQSNIADFSINNRK
jgi:hypothetical protein